jgi:hypothetical protein
MLARWYIRKWFHAVEKKEGTGDSFMAPQSIEYY